MLSNSYKKYKSIIIMRHRACATSINDILMKQKLYELAKAEVLFKLTNLRQVDVQETLRLKYLPITYKFYSSVDILVHLPVGES